MDDEIWNMRTSNFEDKPLELIIFYEEIKSVCKKDNFSISHEDGHGAFIIENYSEGNVNWLECAHKNF